MKCYGQQPILLIFFHCRGATELIHLYPFMYICRGSPPDDPSNRMVAGDKIPWNVQYFSATKLAMSTPEVFIFAHIAIAKVLLCVVSWAHRR